MFNLPQSDGFMYLAICLTFGQIKSSSREQFKKSVDQSVHMGAFNYLTEKQKKSRKVLHIQYKDLKMQDYMKSKLVDIQFCKLIFILRSRMLDISSNYPNKSNTTFCPICGDKETEDSQSHIMICPQLSDNQIVNQLPKYEDLFNEDICKQIQVAAIIQTNFRRRKKKTK